MPAAKAPNPLLEEKRRNAAKLVTIKFIDAENNFNILDEEGNLKYVGIVKGPIPNIDDYCTCQSFYHGNVKAFIDSHGFAFQCKHLIQAREVRYAGFPEMRHQ